jgi:hypothetical protein
MGEWSKLTKVSVSVVRVRKNNISNSPYPLLKNGAGGNLPVEAGFTVLARTMGDSKENR